MLTTATHRPLVLTPKGHLSVPAIKVFRETVYPAQVITISSRIIITNFFFYFDVFGFIFMQQSRTFLLLPFIRADIDECTAHSHNCDPSLATCNNTFGSFICACIQGYTGEGVKCSGDTRLC